MYILDYSFPLPYISIQVCKIQRRPEWLTRVENVYYLIIPDKPAMVEKQIGILLLLPVLMVLKLRQVFLPGTDAAAACFLKEPNRSAEEVWQPAVQV